MENNRAGHLLNRRPSPSPVLGFVDTPYWDYMKKGEFRLQRCLECGHHRYIPASNCTMCLSEQFEWAKMSGRGKIASWCVFHRPYFPQMPPPYVCLIVETEEGPLVVGNLIDGTAEELRLDLPVEALFEPVIWEDGSEGQLVQWRLVR